MKGWQVKKIGEVCTLKSGTTVNKNLEEISGDIPYLKVADLNIPGNNPEIVTSSRFLNQKSLKENSIFPVGTTIFPKRGGAILTNKKRLTTVPICTDLNIMGVIPSNILLPKFLYFYFLNIDMRELGSGSSIPQINNYDIEPLIISFPPLPEQKRIVAILDEAFEGIDRAIANTEKNLANSGELFESYLNTIFTQEGDGWVEKKLKDLIDISHGYAFKGSDFKTSNDVEKLIVLTPGNYLENGELYFTSKNTKRLTIGSPPKGYLFNMGDLTVVMTDLSSKMKILGKPAFVNSPNILHNQRIGRVLFKGESISPRYLFYFLRTRIFANKIKETATGTMVRHTAPQRILSNKISIPKHFDEQLYITSKLDELAAETQRLETIYRQKLAALKELKQSILQKAFTGELTADTASHTTKTAQEVNAA